MILDGEALAKKVYLDVKKRVAELEEKGVRPGLCAIRVGSDPASQLYVGKKIRACENCGIKSKAVILDETAEESELISAIQKENEDPSTHGILIQLPLPSSIDTQIVIEAISPKKDVDGFHPFNVGRVATGVGGFPPCTPKGILRLLDEYGLDVRGKEVVIVGASRIAGRPTAELFLSRMATITVCHIETKDLVFHTRRAEILVVAVGRPGLITKEMISQGVVIVDVGVNRIIDSNNPRGFRVVGDVAPSCRERAYAWTPVPGGVGPMTVAMLLENTVIAAEASLTGITV